MTQHEVIKLLRDEVRRARSQVELAKRWGISSAYISSVLNYRLPPGPMIIGPLGLEKVITIDYRPKANGRKR